MEAANKLVVFMQNVFITGGSSQFPGLKRRIELELLSFRPTGSLFSVTQATHPARDAWRGARHWACVHQNGDAFKASSITRQMYEECGPGYLTEHQFSNRSFL